MLNYFFRNNNGKPYLAITTGIGNKSIIAPCFTKASRGLFNLKEPCEDELETGGIALNRQTHVRYTSDFNLDDIITTLWR